MEVGITWLRLGSGCPSVHGGSPEAGVRHKIPAPKYVGCWVSRLGGWQQGGVCGGVGEAVLLDVSPAQDSCFFVSALAAVGGYVGLG